MYTYLILLWSNIIYHLKFSDSALTDASFRADCYIKFQVSMSSAPKSCAPVFWLLHLLWFCQSLRIFHC